MDKLKLIAHRGIFNNKDIPENSILAFKKALEKEYSIELDIQLTKDNILVVFHDENLKRMTNYHEKICNMTYDELKKLKLLKTNETIPTLNEVLKLVNGKVNVYIELKSFKSIKKICNKLCQELKNYNHKHIIQSFNPRIVKWFHKNSPQTYSGLLINKKLYKSIFGKIIIKYCKPNFLSISKKYVNKNGLNNLYKEYPIIIWTILDNEETNKYKNITDTFICNNLPFNK